LRVGDIVGIFKPGILFNDVGEIVRLSTHFAWVEVVRCGRPATFYLAKKWLEPLE